MVLRLGHTSPPPRLVSSFRSITRAIIREFPIGSGSDQLDETKTAENSYICAEIRDCRDAGRITGRKLEENEYVCVANGDVVLDALKDDYSAWTNSPKNIMWVEMLPNMAGNERDLCSKK